MKTLSDLDHPNIVRMIESAEVWDDKDIKEYGIVMEYLENGSLYNLKKPDLYQAQEFEESFIVDCILQICEGLQVIHGNGIIHKDLNPRNVMLH